MFKSIEMGSDQDSASKAAIPVEFLKMEAVAVKRMFVSSSRRKQGKGAPGYLRDVAYAFIRQLFNGLGVEQTQFLTPTTDKVYNYVTKMKRAAPKTVDLETGAKGHWIGHSQANNVMLYIHGGGFYGAATTGHIRYLYTLQREMAKAGHDFAIFVLTYTLSPGGVYPLQLKQAAFALKHLIDEENRDPSTILLGGDSAGGNLAGALLQHIAHPHPDVPNISLSRPLHAALLISPWVSFRTEGATFSSNSETDYVTSKAIRRAANAYIAPGTRHDSYSEPVMSPQDWWADVATHVLRHIFIWGGGGEVLLDGIQSFADKVSGGFARADPAATYRQATEKGAPRFSFVVTPKHAHEEMIIDEVFFRTKKGEGAKEIENWLSSVLPG